MWGDRCVHQPYCGHHYAIYIKLTPCDGSVLFQWSWGKREKRKIKHITVGPVAKIPCSQCRGPGFDVWSGQWHPTLVLLPGESHGWRSLVGCSPWGQEESDMMSDFTFTFHSHALEKEMATHASVLAWRIPGTGEPGGLPSMGSHRVRHDWSHLVVVVVVVVVKGRRTVVSWEVNVKHF